MKPRVLRRPILGFTAGAITGGALVAAAFTLAYATTYPVEGGTFIPDGQRIIGWAMASFVFATGIWGVGLIFVGCPIWALLERLGTRGPLTAALSGVVAVYAVGLLWFPSSIEDAVGPGRTLLAISGGMVGWVIERVAYRPIKPPKPPPVRPS